MNPYHQTNESSIPINQSHPTHRQPHHPKQPLIYIAPHHGPQPEAGPSSGTRVWSSRSVAAALRAIPQADLAALASAVPPTQATETSHEQMINMQDDNGRGKGKVGSWDQTTSRAQHGRWGGPSQGRPHIRQAEPTHYTTHPNSSLASPATSFNHSTRHCSPPGLDGPSPNLPLRPGWRSLGSTSAPPAVPVPHNQRPDPHQPASAASAPSDKFQPHHRPHTISRSPEIAAGSAMGISTDHNRSQATGRDKIRTTVVVTAEEPRQGKFEKTLKLMFAKYGTMYVNLFGASNQARY